MHEPMLVVVWACVGYCIGLCYLLYGPVLIVVWTCAGCYIGLCYLLYGPALVVVWACVGCCHRLVSNEMLLQLLSAFLIIIISLLHFYCMEHMFAWPVNYTLHLLTFYTQHMS